MLMFHRQLIISFSFIIDIWVSGNNIIADDIDDIMIDANAKLAYIE
jgi:hypothetical protein